MSAIVLPSGASVQGDLVSVNDHCVELLLYDTDTDKLLELFGFSADIPYFDVVKDDGSEPTRLTGYCYIRFHFTRGKDKEVVLANGLF